MELYIGGFAQGKLRYLKKKYPDRELKLWDEKNFRDWPKGNEGRAERDGKELFVWNHLHLIIRELLLRKENPEELLKILEDSVDCVISDEIGNGIVPVDPFEREYREQTGRILERLSEQAKLVEKITCGLGMKLK